ncbi:hypothetical protein DESPIG_02772 [Desulfovibrio piger ATCC 29098]|uniref:Uncharacterized protein n=1 Tax=Desulfovibrio piger ATCC 29098 TaxID=411464 RepID=B6WXE6_9BACT|nr:hypothetical protein DESPIG_02772 [Desulfovibrio piger ATCC 29098]
MQRRGPSAGRRARLPGCMGLPGGAIESQGALPRGAYSKARRGACMSHTRRAEKNGVA